MNSVAPTLEDVAREAGVSRSTASRAINGGLRVSPEAQAAVDDAVARLRYTPNRAARSLVTKRTDSIALVVPESGSRVLTDPFLAGLLRGTTAATAHTDLQLVILLNEKGTASNRVARYLASGHVDGAVIASHHERQMLEDAVSRANLPAVFIGRPFGDTPRHYVDLDNVEGGRLAARRLIERGCRRIATITGPPDLSAGIDRLQGWREELAAAGLPTDAVVEGDFTPEAGVLAAERLLAEHPDLDGVFVASDVMAEGAMRVLTQAGRSIPDDVAVVGFDNLGVAQHAVPRLTTIDNPVIEVTRTATELLLDLLAGEDIAPGGRIHMPHLVEGESA